MWDRSSFALAMALLAAGCSGSSEKSASPCDVLDADETGVTLKCAGKIDTSNIQRDILGRVLQADVKVTCDGGPAFTGIVTVLYTSYTGPDVLGEYVGTATPPAGPGCGSLVNELFPLTGRQMLALRSESSSSATSFGVIENGEKVCDTSGPAVSTPEAPVVVRFGDYSIKGMVTATTLTATGRVSPPGITAISFDINVDGEFSAPGKLDAKVDFGTPSPGCTLATMFSGARTP